MKKSEILSMEKSIIGQFEEQTGLHGIKHTTKERSDGKHITFFIYNPSEIFFSILNRINDELTEDNPFRDHLVLKRKTEQFSLKSPEVTRLQLLLSESLTVSRHSFKDAFFARYIDSGLGAETKIQVSANHLVFGRRGAGKSSLLVYSMRKLEQKSKPYAWIDMQVYEKREDYGVIADVLLEILIQLDSYINDKLNCKIIKSELQKIIDKDPADQSIADIRPLGSKFKMLLTPVVERHGELTLFIDDLHVIKPNLQPQFLGSLYSFSRGNRIFLKISAVQNFTRNYDASNHIGLDTPNDAQIISLDLNLTTPDIAGEHIKNILDAYSILSGVPSLRAMCGESAIYRLVWIAGGVPRDAINLFQQALTKSIQKREKKISVTSVNLAATEVVEDKQRYLDADSSGAYQEAMDLFQKIKSFCINDKKINAFLIKVDASSETYKNVLKLIDLRLLHVLSKSITPEKAGERYVALLLDYGFYVGIRLARSVGIFQKKLQALTYTQLRYLPKFKE